MERREPGGRSGWLTLIWVAGAGRRRFKAPVVEFHRVWRGRGVHLYPAQLPRTTLSGAYQTGVGDMIIGDGSASLGPAELRLSRSLAAH